MSEITTCFLDLDLTTIDRDGRLYAGLADVLRPENRDFGVTVLTGRGHPRFLQAIGENPELTPSPDIPVALEHGARIVDSSGNNVHYVPLPQEDIEQIKDFVSTRDLSSVSFYPRDTKAPTITWSAVPPEELGLGRAYYTNTRFLSDKNELFRVMEAEQPCTVTCRTFEGHHENLPNTLRYYTRGKNVNFLPQGADKGTAALIIADIAGLQLRRVLAAGNDRNDIPLLTLPDLGCPVLVGHDLHHDEKKLLPEHTIYVHHHNNLGGVIFESTRKR